MDGTHYLFEQLGQNLQAVVAERNDLTEQVEQLRSRIGQLEAQLDVAMRPPTDEST